MPRPLAARAHDGMDRRASGASQAPEGAAGRAVPVAPSERGIPSAPRRCEGLDLPVLVVEIAAPRDQFLAVSDWRRR